MVNAGNWGIMPPTKVIEFDEKEMLLPRGKL
jgi:hypothetical protein